tara:strand:- start:288 stop:1292 length:1005 start_codon:yes stop_codon:yes gene_type:complete
MRIAQRSTSVASVSDGYHTVDRFRVNGTTGTFTMSQESDAPAGFSKSLKMLATADISAAAGNLREIYYSFEGQDLQLLEKGTSTAKKVSLSFYVKSNVTGLKTVYLLDKDNNRLNSQNYTINSSATWERKTITFDGDTTGALDNDNARSLDIHFPIVAGSNYTGGTQQTAWGADTVNERVSSSITQIDTTNEYWQITGVQLEVSDHATSFEHLNFADELRRCRRYCYVLEMPANDFLESGTGFAQSDTVCRHFVQLPVAMRTNPTFTGTATAVKFYSNNQGASFNADTFTFSGQPVKNDCLLVALYATTSSITAGQGGTIQALADGSLTFEAEL